MGKDLIFASSSAAIASGPGLTFSHPPLCPSPWPVPHDHSHSSPHDPGPTLSGVDRLCGLLDGKVRDLGSDDQPRNARRCQRRKHTRDQRRKGKTRDIATALGRELAQDTNLDTERANVAKAADGIGRDELRAGGEVGVCGVGGEGREGVVFVLLIQYLFLRLVMTF